MEKIIKEKIDIMNDDSPLKWIEIASNEMIKNKVILKN